MLDMPYDQKYELQQFVFPNGATFNKENKRVRTPGALIIWANTCFKSKCLLEWYLLKV